MRDHIRRPEYETAAKKSVGIRELKAHAARILRSVRESRTSYLVTHRGRAIGVILPVDAEPEDAAPQAFEAVDASAAWQTFLRAGPPGRAGFVSWQTCGDSMVAKRRAARPSRARRRPTIRYTVDASVFVNAFNPHEDGHAESLQILSAIQERGDPVIAPALLVPEIASAIARATGDSDAPSGTQLRPPPFRT